MAGTVLVVANQSRWREHIRTMIEFMDQDCVWVSDLDTSGPPVFPGEKPAAVFVVDDGAERSPVRLLERVRERFPATPVYLLQEVGVVADPALLGQAHGRILLPLRFAPLAAVLNRLPAGIASGITADNSLELFRSLVGDSPAITRVRRLIEQVAGSDANVLILGESGTGKEVVARKLHYFSARRDRPFVPINCGAIPPDLLESELFGHEKGAFTGAISTRQGRFELAEGGTLFLDEIGDMSLPMQVKLLRVLQERIFERVGANRSLKADVRILAATHRDLEGLIREGRFREDLFYRLNVFPIDMPPLRERRADIPLLIEELVLRFKNEKRAAIRLTPAALDALSHAPWPGNVRELANLIERLTILYPNGTVDLPDLPEKYTAHVSPRPAPAPATPQAAELPIYPYSLPRLPREGLDIKEHLNQLEYTLIKQALDEAGGVVAHAAERLKLRRTTLVEKLRKYGLARSATDEVSGF